MKTLLFSVLLFPSLLACKSEEWPEVLPAPRPVETAVVPSKPSEEAPKAEGPKGKELELSEELKNALIEILDTYDGIHQSLVRDQTTDIAKNAKNISELARTTRLEAKDASLAAYLSNVETTSRKLDEGDIESTRFQYGELSKSLVSILQLSSELQSGRHVFECPMTKGYGKWIQKNDHLLNPYFGAAMLTCGDESQWGP